MFRHIKFFPNLQEIWFLCKYNFTFYNIIIFTKKHSCFFNLVEPFRSKFFYYRNPKGKSSIYTSKPNLLKLKNDKRIKNTSFLFPLSFNHQNKNYPKKSD